MLAVKPTGPKLWQFKYRIDGKEKLLSNGIYPEVGLAMAQARKDEARILLAAGKDPGEANKEKQRQERARRGNTFEGLALDFRAKAAAEGRPASTQTKNEWLMGMANASFGRPVPGATYDPALMHGFGKRGGRLGGGPRGRPARPQCPHGRSRLGGTRKGEKTDSSRLSPHAHQSRREY